jgi:molecular chaperone GrpE (heat shock protein)
LTSTAAFTPLPPRFSVLSRVSSCLQFGAVGDKLDPNVHEVLFEAPHPTLPHGTLAQVIKSGFTIKDRVLRPAKVGVAKNPAGAPPPTDAEKA